ncbi:AAA family ATPase [Acidithiobacillus ferridurans]|uniref:AAA family ATPase n=1 Tax=Acidithiobacillus ferridurans TaxID=1232575 RepID=UPI001C06DE48|nr:AAA family ATPase [Acidithiobacillus ferridurans]MBU2805896.1 AAA family ATPase [Acidithiobacillus ferridurans]
MTNLEDAEQQAQKIFREAQANLQNIETEEDVKIQIINRILNDSLGWPYSTFRAETHHENGYSDYILIENEKLVLLLEAKRTGLLDVRTAEKDKVRQLKISGSALKNTMPGIDQAAGYALSNGIPIAVLTDGLVWIIFKTFVPGQNFKEKEAIVFPSVDAVLSDFSIFYDLLSRRQFGRRIYNSVFDEIHNKRLMLTQELVAPLKESDIGLSQKSDIAFDLDKVFSTFFSRLTGDEDEDLLIDCFVETRESRIADFSLEKMTRSILGNISPSQKDVDSQLTDLITSNVEVGASSFESGQTIFIVGPTGAGKTTFLDRFFRKTLDNSIRVKCLLIAVNCLDATGREETALSWLTESLVSILEKALYNEGSPTWDDLLGLYHGEYERRARGVDSQLYSRDRQAFKEKFGEFLEQKVENDREGYLKRLLEDIVNNRKLLPVMVIDNTDEFSIDYKQRIFQIPS